ncbi:sensor histidine kinase [Paenibacillus rigui]|uniref:histidine kinase n=1 Tax=Paenibacillus rigui TaxID=554312 RepID=A0A229ULP3_9BACL|nr:sensor histidine kinase [Paenibacillus rigui]OXM83819.1 hypothetical protein CF651_23180 [Paenibacillus rigui]
MSTYVRAFLRTFQAWKFRTKVLIFYAAFIVIPFILISFNYYRTSSNIILTNSGNSMLEVVKKNIQFTDMAMEEIRQRSLSLLADPDLYRVFNREQPPQEPLELLEMDRKVSDILNKYYYFDTYIDSVQLVTSYYSFGNVSTVTSRPTLISVRPGMLTGSKIYQQAIHANGKLIWFPTYDFSKQFHQDELAAMDPRYRFVFSAARMMKSSIVEGGVFKVWSQQVEVPMLLINFNESFFRNVRSELHIKDSYMYVLSGDGTVIAHPDMDLLTQQESSDWLKQAVANKEGTVISSINGEKMFICYATSDVTGWMSVLVIPYDQLIRNLKLIDTSSLYITLILLVLSVYLAYVLSGWLTKPMKKLLIGFHMTGNGDFTTKIAEPDDLEFGIVIKKFNSMNDRIHELIKENYEVKLREKEAELMALNLQLNPHFLYNTLNVINWMALDKDQEEISRMLVSLSLMLQYAVRNKEEEVAFRDDLVWLQSYIHIMENRYMGIFKVEYELDAIPSEAKVPKMFLQPFVENAIIHGFSYHAEGGLIHISGQRVEENLVFTIRDNGTGMHSEQIASILNSETAGVGMMNVQNRIQLLYGTSYGISIASAAGEGTEITITFPLHG